MLRRAPVTLWRSTLAELWRHALLTTAILVVVIAFALTARFFAQGRLGPVDTLRFMALASVPMLQFALPFAAGFAATITYHRMAQDRELAAAAAAGIGHARLLAPALISGLLMSLVLTLLVQLAIPRFLSAMEELVSDRIGKLVLASVDRREPIRVGDRMIYADRVRPLPRENGGDQLMLYGVLIVDADSSGTVKYEVAARVARIGIYPGRTLDQLADGHPDHHPDTGQTLVIANLMDVTVRDAEGAAWSDHLELANSFPGAFDDDPKYLTAPELARARQDPDRYFNIVESRRRTLAIHLGERRTTDAVRASMAATGRAVLRGPDGRTLVLHGKGAAWDPDRRMWAVHATADPASPAPVTAELLDPRDHPRAPALTTFKAAKACFGTDLGGADPASRQLTLDVLLLDTTITADGSDVPSRLAEQRFGRFVPDPDPAAPLLLLPSAELLDLARPAVDRPQSDEFVAAPARELDRQISRLRREITSKQHERVAAAAACLVMLVTGAVTAMRLGRVPTLIVYLWSFFPAIGAVVTIAAGQRLTHEVGAPGLAVLWGGVGLLAAYAGAAYLVVRRH